MSPTSYRAAPSRVNIKGGCGIRTHARFYTPDGFQDRSLQPDLGNPPTNSPYGIRTRVTAVKRRCLNPLTNGPNFMGTSGLEPPTSRLSGVRSNQLSYKPILKSFDFSGDEEIRTLDPLLARQVLSQLSYIPI